MDVDFSGANLLKSRLLGAKLSGSNLNMALVIPLTWDKADYNDYSSNNDINLFENIKAAVRKKSVVKSLLYDPDLQS